MNGFSKQICEACLPDAPPAKTHEINLFLAQQPNWTLSTDVTFPQIVRVYKLKDFASALTFSNAIGVLAETEGHHPQITLEYGQVTVKWWSQKIKGLHVNDFILASRTEELYATYR